MIISANWLKKFVPNLPEISELSRLIGSRLVEVESVTNLGEKYKDVIIAKVISAEKVAGSDHLNLCKIDDNKVRENVKRDENDLIQIVCGAENVRSGIFIAWLPPESIVPETFGSDDEFVLGARKLMGIMSNGMIASLRELGLGDEHDGILEISGEIFGDKLIAGAKFSDVFELNDYLLEVENKSLTHRPDCFGIIGFAREVAGILGEKFVTPDWLVLSEDDENGKIIANSIKVFIKNIELCQKYGVAVLDVSDFRQQEELTIQKTYLLRSGMRPIEGIVDITNFLMLLTGQPLHAFDYDKLVAVSGGNCANIVVRNAENGEKMTLLDDKEITLREGDILVSAGENGEVPVALAGAMGAKNTIIDENTKRIIVESATFNLYNLRNTQMRHGIFSEAITRFTKGQSAGMAKPVLHESIKLLSENGAKIIGKIVESEGEIAQITPIKIKQKYVNNLLGTNFSNEKIIETLENVGFLVEVYGENEALVFAPFWRTDIQIEEDIIEEIGRLNGYDNIKLDLPLRSFKAVENSLQLLFEQKIRQILTSAGANELLTYTFVHGDLLKSVGQKTKNSYRITNSISPDLQYYRQSITPSLLSKVNQNIRAGFDKFAIFEMNKVSPKINGEVELNHENVPNEWKNLAFVYADKKTEASFYEVKKYVQFLFDSLNVKIEFLVIKPENGVSPDDGPFEKKRSARIILLSEENSEKKEIGIVGEYKRSVAKKFKLPENSAGFELRAFDELADIWNKAKPEYNIISKFQSAERDLSIKIARNISYAEVINAIEKDSPANENLKINTKPLDIYSDNERNKTITLRFTISPFDKTLSGEEIRRIISKIEKIVQNKFEAEII